MNHQIDNYPGFPEGIDGVSLTQRMEAQAKQSGLEILRAQVRGLELRENPKLLCTDAGDIRAKPLRQILTAASDGAVAAQMAEEFLSKTRSLCSI